MTGAGWQVSKHSARRLKRRYRRERWLKALGILAIVIALGVLVLLLGSVIARGYPAFVKTEIALEVNFKAELIDPGQPGGGRYGRIIRNALFEAFPEVRQRAERRRLLKLISRGARFELRRMVESDPELVGTVKKVWLTASSDVDMLTKGSLPRDVPQDERRLSDRQLGWLDSMDAAGNVRTAVNWQFFIGSDSREPELAGIGGALAGSFWTLAITLILAFPLGVGASPLQVVSHHVLPLAMPGIMTGTIIGMARALGETAPLLMIGMVAFIVDIPAAPFDSATALPVQVFLWADSPERGFTEKMSAAIIVLLAFLIIMNALAVYLRRRFEIRW